jgi:hypothetical protein
MSVVIDEIDFGGWRGCVRVSNGVIEAVAPVAMGPRIMRFGFVGRPNEFRVFEHQAGAAGGSDWRLYGGHRLWRAPEIRPDTYAPDNEAIDVIRHADGVTLRQRACATTGLIREIAIRLHDGLACCDVTHRLLNRGEREIMVSAWAMSAMERGGTAILPLPPYGPHSENLLPKGSLVLWSYTDLTDARWSIGARHLMLHQNPSIAAPQKIGLSSPLRWAAHVRDGRLFVKTFAIAHDAAYPDFGARVEVFSNADMLELETLSPLHTIRPSDAITHTERWRLFDGVETPRTDDEIARMIERTIGGVAESW